MELLPILLFLITSVAECLMLSKVLVPHYKLFGEDALLRCEFNLGHDRLYAVKWYKDNEEFFRYVPRFNPPIYTHPVEGVRVESSKSNDKRVLLRSLTIRSTGIYRCEVSAEAPSFASIMGEGWMTVVYLPKEAPQITGNLRDEYEVGDVLDLNCTSAKSFPPAKLSWYINDSPLEVPFEQTYSTQPHHHRSPYHSPEERTEEMRMRHSSSSMSGALTVPYRARRTSVASIVHNLMVTSLRLHLQLQAHHFGPKGEAKIRCVATISPLFWQDRDEKILGHHGHVFRPQKKSETQQQSTKEYSSDFDDDEVVDESGQRFEEGDKGSLHKYPYMEENHHRRHSNNNNNLRTSHHSTSSTTLHLENDGDDDEDDYFGQLNAFKREALVLVRGGCSSIRITHRLRHIIPFALLLIVLNGINY